MFTSELDYHLKKITIKEIIEKFGSILMWTVD